MQMIKDRWNTSILGRGIFYLYFRNWWYTYIMSTDLDLILNVFLDFDIDYGDHILFLWLLRLQDLLVLSFSKIKLILENLPTICKI